MLVVCRYHRPTFRKTLDSGIEMSEDYRSVEEMNELVSDEMVAIDDFLANVLKLSPKATSTLTGKITKVNLPSDDLCNHLGSFYHVLPVELPLTKEEEAHFLSKRAGIEREFTLHDDFVFQQKIKKTWREDQKKRRVTKSDAEFKNGKGKPGGDDWYKYVEKTVSC